MNAPTHPSNADAQHTDMDWDCKFKENVWIEFIEIHGLNVVLTYLWLISFTMLQQ
jgi:hypothetical protein